MRRGYVLIGGFLLVLAGCATPPAHDAETQDGAFIRDTARVVSLDPELGQAVLDLHGRQVHAFWQTEVELAQGGVVAPDPQGLKLPVGQYRVPVVRKEAFPAEVGDTISFRGMWTGDQIFLRGAAKAK